MIKKSANTVTFIFLPKERDYKSVAVAGDFNKWSPAAHPMRKEKDGSFQITLTLEPGEHQFRYCADGAWFNEPEADGEVSNSFGSKNCVIKVAPKAEPAPKPAKAETATKTAPAAAPDAPITQPKGRAAENSRRPGSAGESKSARA